MDLKLRGKRVLVTRSTVGIGFAIAQGLARERAEVIVNGRTEQKVAEAVQRINSEVGSPAIGLPLISPPPRASLVAQAGRVDILVNNVGIFWPVPFLEISDQDLVSHLRSQRNERRAALARAFASNAEAQLGPHHFCLQ